MRQSERKLRKNGLAHRVDDGSIIIKGAREVTIFVKDKDGDLDWDETDQLAEQVSQLLKWGGSRTAGGWWNLDKDFDYDAHIATLADQIGADAYN